MDNEVKKVSRKKKICLIALALCVSIIAVCTSYRTYFLLFDYHEPRFWEALKNGLIGGNHYNIWDGGPPAGLAAPIYIIVFLFAPIIAGTLAFPIKSWSWLPWPIIIAPAVVPIFLLAIYIIVKKITPLKQKLLLGPLLFLWLVYAFFCVAAIEAVMSI